MILLKLTHLYLFPADGMVPLERVSTRLPKARRLCRRMGSNSLTLILMSVILWFFNMVEHVVRTCSKGDYSVR